MARVRPSFLTAIGLTLTLVPALVFGQASVNLNWVDVRFVDVRSTGIGQPQEVTPTGPVMRFAPDQANVWDATAGQDFQVVAVSYSYNIGADIVASAGLEMTFPTLPNAMRTAEVSPADGIVDFGTLSGAVGFLPVLNRVPPGPNDGFLIPPMPSEPLEFQVVLRQINTGAPGTNPVIASSEVVTVFSGEQPGPDVIVSNVEVIQSVQTADQTVPLVAGKRTVARVFLRLTESSEFFQEPVPVALRGFRDGQELAGRPSQIGADAFPVSFGFRDERSDILGSANFELPLPWTAAGNLELRVEIDPGGTIDNEETENNSHLETVAFHPVRPFRVNYYRLCVDEDCGDHSILGSPRGLSFAEKTFPVAEEGLIYENGGVFGLLPDIKFDPEAFTRDNETVIGNLDEVRFNYARDLIKTHLLIASALPGGALQDVTLLWGPTGQGIDNRLIEEVARFPFFPVPLRPFDVWVLASPEAAENLRFPNIVGRAADRRGGGDCLGSLDGQDRALRVESALGFDLRRKILVPDNKVDFHPNCEERDAWIGPGSFSDIFDFLRVDGASVADGEHKMQDAPPALVSGTFAEDGSVANLNPIFQMPAGTRAFASEPGGTYCFTFDAGGDPLAEYCPQLEFNSLDEIGGFARSAGQNFAMIVPVAPGSDAATLRFNGIAVEGRTQSPSAPTVTITAPSPGDVWVGGVQTISWTGVDADGDDLTYMILASRDGGGSWAPVTAKTVQTEFEIDVDQANGSDNTLFQVLVSDGFHTATATVGPIDIVQRPQISAEPPVIDVGPVPVGTEFEIDFVARNVGNGLLEISAITSDNPAFKVSVSQFPLRAPLGGGVRIPIVYQATTIGLDAGTLSLASNAVDQPEQVVNVSANAIALETPTIRVFETSINFGQVSPGQVEEAALTIRNAGTDELVVTTEVSGAGFSVVPPAPPTAQVGPTVVAGNGQTEIIVAFSPASEGNFAGTLRLSTNDPNRPQVEVSLAGSAVVPPPSPTISPGGVLSAATFQPGIVSGSWVTIFGNNLANSTRTWDGAINGSQLPAELDGVSVLINGRRSAVFFISPGQLNVQAPNDTTVGTTEVQVVVNGVAGPVFNAELREVAPGFFMFDPEGRRYLAAVHLDATFVGKADLFGGAVVTRPAISGDRILLFGTGFGATNPPTPSGVIPAAAPLASDVRITIGGIETVVEFAGIAGAGLYQFNVVIPPGLPAGDAEVIATINGASSPSGTFLSIGN